jgi:solute carrier family 25 protein 34/35
MSTLAQQQKPRNKTKETALGFVIGGLAACGAVTFTNPWEVWMINYIKFHFY